jgi:hypothetical protein
LRDSDFEREIRAQLFERGFPSIAFMGVPMLTAVIGKSAVLSVVIGNLILSFVLLPLTLTCLRPAALIKKVRQ